MPLNDYRCPNGHICEKMVPLKDFTGQAPCPICHEVASVIHLTPPMVIGDIPGYTSPIDGKWIEGRRARVEDLARNNCRPWEAGEKEEFMKRCAERDRKLDQAIDDTVEGEIANMPARKRELLEQEVQAGASVEFVRSTRT